MTAHPQSMLRRVSGAVATGLAFGAVAALLSGGIVALRIAELAQPFNPRTLSVIGVMAGGACLATLGHWLIVRPVLRRWPRLLHVLVAWPVLMALVCAASAGLFAVVLRDVMDIEESFSSLHAFVFGHGSAAYLMLLAGWSMMFPWPVPLLSALLAVLLEWPSRGSIVTPHAVDAPIAPGRLAAAMRQQS